MNRLSLLFFCIMALNSNTLYAQNEFAPIGAEWSYSNYRYGSGDIIYEVLYKDKVMADSVVMGQKCRVVSQVASIRTTFLPASLVEKTVALRDLYIYDNKDTVFVFNENFNRFTPLYVFNAHVGDTICLPVIPIIANNSSRLMNNPISGDTSFCFVIDSISSVTYDKTPLRTFYNHYISDRGTGFSDEVPIYNWNYFYSGSYMASAYAEQIGGLRAGLLPIALYPTADPPVLPGTPQYLDNSMTNLRCYSDSSTHIRLVKGNCDTLDPIPLSIDYLNATKGAISIYPNPAYAEVTIQSLTSFPLKTSISLLDISGKSIYTVLPAAGDSNAKIYTLNVAPGIYLLKIQNDIFSYHQKLIIQH